MYTSSMIFQAVLLLSLEQCTSSAFSSWCPWSLDANNTWFITLTRFVNYPVSSVLNLNPKWLYIDEPILCVTTMLILNYLSKRSFTLKLRLLLEPVEKDIKGKIIISERCIISIVSNRLWTVQLLPQSCLVGTWFANWQWSMSQKSKILKLILKAELTLNTNRNNADMTMNQVLKLESHHSSLFFFNQSLNFFVIFLPR